MTQITGDLVKTAAKAYNKATNSNDVPDHMGLIAALTAAYPLIRNAVLRAAMTELIKMGNARLDQSDDLLATNVAQASRKQHEAIGLLDAAQAIRDLMTDTAVAVPKEGEGE